MDTLLIFKLCCCPVPQLLKLYEDAINNDVRGKPKYEAPVTVGEDGKKLFLCYEVQGQSNHTYNLISDSCVSVNAYYTWKSKPAKGNVVSKIGVLAVDNSGECLEIEVGLEKCTIRINGEVMRKYKAAGVNVTRHRFGRRVKIVVPNCNGVAMVMWVNCLLPGTQPKLPFKLSKGASLRSTSHGLLGRCRGQHTQRMAVFTKGNFCAYNIKVSSITSDCCVPICLQYIQVSSGMLQLRPRGIVCRPTLTTLLLSPTSMLSW